MPKKGRANPCEDPLKKGHTRRSQYNDVHAIGPVLLKEFRNKLPEYEWKEGLRLCGTCRLRAHNKIQKRDEYLSAAQRSASGDFDHLFSPAGKNLLNII